MKICYQEKNFRQDRIVLINRVNRIIEEYHSKGYDLTLRQVYYQLVARDVIPNNERSYKNLGNLISDGRMAGLIDWNAIIDRTRNLRKNNHWSSPAEIIEACANQFAYNKWEEQDNYVEVWVEKDALVGVVGQICGRLDVPFFSCRGYVSQSEMWGAAQRLERLGEDKGIVIIHLGDHDPSGKDMSRDIVDRLNTFGVYPKFMRIALNIDQIEKYNPPPNPTKLTDSRCHGYIREFGHECWELDALKPEIIEELIRETVLQYCDLSLFEKSKERENESKKLLKKVSASWSEIQDTYSA
ncbi:hypothetical protein [Desulforamulus aquiferis]|uniref:Wadjet protein JetD C-terminal domain-containing protein n=1 Tax=Desulforamulus aquiferis TaxID=1397668 RepID=A0AAW7Z8V3_9FIRM|nr:hypothetical protein [Desulforamulus aquiferis]MDO7785786.1 hypothetical protein [Desulforamulus aquiferis]